MSDKITIRFTSEEIAAMCLGYAGMSELLEDYPTLDAAVKEIWVDAEVRRRKEPTDSKMIEDGVIETNEFDLHHISSSMYHLDFDGNVHNEPIHAVILKAVGKDKEGNPLLSEEHRKQLEDKINDILRMMHEFDTFLHDVAEYTC